MWEALHVPIFNSWDLPTQSSVNHPFIPTWLKSFYSLTHAEADALESRTSRRANQRGSCGRGRVAGSVAAETAATSQLMKASIHLHSHNIHAERERDSPQRKQAPFKEKTIGPPQQIPANLPGPERRGEARRGVSWVMDACPSPC